MEKILGVDVYKISDVLANLGPMRHISEAANADLRYYSYGGVKGLLARRYPNMRPVSHGAYLPVERVNEALAALNQRPRAAPLSWKEGIPPIMLCGIPMVNMRLFADGVGRSHSNIAKLYFADDSPIYDLFIQWDGGFALTKAEYREFMAWIPKFGDGPLPTKYRKNPQKRRGARLNYRKIVVAKAVTTTQEEGEPEL